jgi:hypothetical protein
MKSGWGEFLKRRAGEGERIGIGHLGWYKVLVNIALKGRKDQEKWKKEGIPDCRKKPGRIAAGIAGYLRRGVVSSAYPRDLRFRRRS